MLLSGANLGINPAKIKLPVILVYLAGRNTATRLEDKSVYYFTI